MNAIIISIGDALVVGQTVDTNSAWLSQELAAIGWAVLSHVTVGDDQAAIERAIRGAAPQCDALIVSGGIGPTPDDLTRQALAAVLDQPLELNERWLRCLEDFFQKRGRPMPEMNRIQAMVPRGAKIILNTCGTAAGIHAKLDFGGMHASSLRGIIESLQGRQIGRILTRLGRINRDNLVEALTQQRREGGFRFIGQILLEMKVITEADLQLALNCQRGVQDRAPVDLCHVFVVPGVPSEMKAMFSRDVLPELKKLGSGGVILSKTLHTFGLGESAIAQMLGDLMDRKRNPTVGTTVASGIVSVRIYSRFDSADEASAKLVETERECRKAIGNLVFGADEETLPQVVGALLKAQKKTVTTAESCTGGLLAKYLTDVPGSSSYFTQGWITYSNDAKEKLLGVNVGPEGAVSENTVTSMAVEAAFLAKADYGVAISGIAGPDGGSEEKPVGTVCIGLARLDQTEALDVEDETKVFARRFLFAGDRETIRDRSAKMALTMLRFHLLGKQLPF